MNRKFLVCRPAVFPQRKRAFQGQTYEYDLVHDAAPMRSRKDGSRADIFSQPKLNHIFHFRLELTRRTAATLTAGPPGIGRPRRELCVNCCSEVPPRDFPQSITNSPPADGSNPRSSRLSTDTCRSSCSP